MASIALGIGLGATALAAWLASRNAGQAADTQANSAREATDTQMQMYNQQRKDQTPWRQAGESALNQLVDTDFMGFQTPNPENTRAFSMSDFNKDPGYQFRMAEGQRALEGSASARGSLNSGGTLRALTRYGQDMGAQEYQSAYNRFNNDQANRFNRLASMAGIGQTANSQLAQAGQNASNNISQNQMAAGNAISAGQIGQSNALNSGISNAMNMWQNQQYINRLQIPKAGA